MSPALSTSFSVEDGVISAILTPFLASEETIDYDALKKILEIQKAAGCNWALIGGSTAEPHCLEDDEWKELVTFGIKTCHEFGMKALVGTGTNCTVKSIKLTQFAQDNGADAVMLTCPYYNRPSQRMLISHYDTICSKFPSMPVMLYNIPGRTGIVLQAETAARIAHQNSNVIAFKEATTDIDNYKLLRKMMPSNVALYSGEDSCLVTAMRDAGFHGIVSVAGNVIVKQLSKVHKLCLKGDFQAAEESFKSCESIIHNLFIEPNPVPVKAAVSLIHGSSDSMRAPLYSALPATRELLKEDLIKLNIL